MLKKRNVLVVLALATATSLAGCSSAAPGGGTASGGGSGGEEAGPVTIQLQGVEYGYTPAAIKQFEKDNPKITVEFSNQQPTFEDGSVQTELRSGTGADAMYISTGPSRVGLLIKNNLLPNLDEIWKKEDLKKTMQPSIVDAVAKYSNGHWYEIPNGTDVFQIAYNKDIFKNLGVSVPTTWEQFIDICNKAKTARITPIVAGYRDGLQAGWMFGQVLQAVAGKKTVSNVLYGDGHWDQESMISAAETLKDWFDKGYMDAATVSALDSKQEQAAFFSGGGAMDFIGSTHLIQAQASGAAAPGKFGFFPLPSPNAGQAPAATAGIGSSWVMNPGSKHSQATKKWLTYVASVKFAKLAVESGGQNSVPARILPSNVKMSPLMKNEIDASKGAGYNPSVIVGAKTKDAWYAAGQGIATGQKTPQQAMADLQSAKEADAANQ